MLPITCTRFYPSHFAQLHVAHRYRRYIILHCKRIHLVIGSRALLAMTSMICILAVLKCQQKKFT